MDLRVEGSESPLTPDESVAGPSTSTRRNCFGAPSKHGRVLTPDQDPWTHNAWDNVDWDDDMQLAAESAVLEQRNAPVPEHLRGPSLPALQARLFELNCPRTHQTN
jgi:hypothetical protein